MTTIAWDGRFLVADRQVSIGTTKYRCNKFRTLSDGSIAAFAGSATDILRTLRHFEDPDNYPMPDDAECMGLVLTPDSLFYSYDGELIELDRDQKIAIGSGGDIALGLMVGGLSAEEAVLRVSEVDAATGMGVDVFDDQNSWEDEDEPESASVDLGEDWGI